jgi:hypothetical protein
MGLDVIVGIVAAARDADEDAYRHFQSQFAAINRVLRSLRLPPHPEPDRLEEVLELRVGAYSDLHRLRRAAAYLQKEDRLPPPMDGGLPPSEDPVLAAYASDLNSKATWPWHHGVRLYTSKRGQNYDQLILHSDCMGYYLPQTFAFVIQPGKKTGIHGEIGSSSGLLAELEPLAKALELPTDVDPEDREWLATLESPSQDSDVPWRRYPVEAHACLVLIRAAQASIRADAAIVFT